MGYQRVRNSGVTGLLDLPGQSAKFSGKTYGYDKTLKLEHKPRQGRGSTGKFVASRPIWAGGSIVFLTAIRLDGWPAPDAFRGQAGTITLQFHTSRTVSLPVRVDALAVSHKEAEGDTPTLAITCTITGAPTFAGWPGTQPAATDPTRTDQEQWQGTSKTIDPQGLQSGAVRYIDVWGSFNNTDAAEEALLTSAIATAAASAPFAGLKVRSATFQRDSDDGGAVVVTFGLTDTAEDVINPNTSTTIDPSDLASGAQAAAINGTPATPDGAAFQVRSETTQELNDGNELTRREYGLNTTKQDIEFPNSPTSDDPSEIADELHVCEVTNSATPPATATPTNFEHFDTNTVRINPGRWRHTHVYRRNSRETEAERSNTHTTTCAGALGTTAQVFEIYATASPPSNPTVSGLAQFDQRVRSINALLTERITTFARNNRETEAERQGTHTTTDPSAIASRAQVTEVYLTASPPSDPTVSGMVKYDQRVRVINPTQTERITEFRLQTRQEEIEREGTHTTTCASGLESRAQVTEIYETSSPPSDPSVSGLVQYEKTEREINGDLTVRVTYFRIQTRSDQAERDNTHAEYTITGGGVTRTGTFGTSGSSADTLASTEFNSNKSDATFKSVFVKKFNATKYLKVVDRVTPYQLINYGFVAEPRLRYAKLDGSDVKVFLAEKVQVDSDKWFALVTPQIVRDVTGRFALRRLVSGSTLQIYTDSSNGGKLTDRANGAAFLGLAIGTVRYVGPSGEVNIAVSAPRVSDIAYMFDYDSLGQIDESLIPPYGFYTTSDLTAANVREWVLASDLGLTVNQLVTGDFSVFTT